MKTIRTVLLLGLISILISGCGGGKSAPTIEISCDEFNQETFRTDNLTIKAGEQISIKLCSNPSTGFQWIETPQNSQPEILSLEGHEFFVQEENGTPLPPGTPGLQIWIFTAQAAGQSQLYFEYSRDWEGGEKGIWTYTLDVTVQ